MDPAVGYRVSKTGSFLGSPHAYNRNVSSQQQRINISTVGRRFKLILLSLLNAHVLTFHLHLLDDFATNHVFPSTAAI